jgi:hypothetical protein
MNKFLPVAAAVAGLFAASVAQADVLLIDDFNTPVSLVKVADVITGDGITWQTAPGSTPLSLPNIATSRRIGVESISVTSDPADAQGITGSVGGSTGRLNFSVVTGDNGNGYVEWTIPAFSVTTPASYFFSVIASALGSISATSVPNVMTFTFDGAGSNDFTTAGANVGAFGSNPAGSPVYFNLTDTEATYLSGGGTLTLKVTGGEGWNLRLDSFAINIPEPTSLALVGLALIGAGVASRRRKA